MKPEIKFFNFEPPLGVREHARNILDEIEQIGPSDANVSGDRFHAKWGLGRYLEWTICFNNHSFCINNAGKSS